MAGTKDGPPTIRSPPMISRDRARAQPFRNLRVAGRGDPLIYSGGFARAYVIEPGRGVAYLALFSEIGFVLLVTTLAGVGVGYWADTNLGTIPIFVLIGLFVGMGVGARAIWLLVSRFLAGMDDHA